MLTKLSVFLGIAALASIAWFQYALVTNAYTSGFETCRAQYQERLIQLQLKSKEKEKSYNDSLNSISTQLTETRLRYENAITHLKSSYDSELYKSNQRAELYQRLSQSDQAKQRALADYTAKLDRSLTEGRELVKQLTETIRTRDSQLRALGVYLEENSKVYE